MWKCKKCGSDCFYQDITGGISEVLEMNKDGEVLDEIDDVEYGDFSCAKCDNSSPEIQEIAYWEEIDEENTKWNKKAWIRKQKDERK